MLCIKLTFRSLFTRTERKTDVIIHGQVSNFYFFFRKVTSRFRMTMNVDQGLSTNQKPRPKKLTNQKTAGAKSHSLQFSRTVQYHQGVLTSFGRVGTVGVERGYSWSFVPFQPVFRCLCPFQLQKEKAGIAANSVRSVTFWTVNIKHL